ncbi:hypothetical protein [Plantibacter sp. YIM 135249]|uniref:hypothetical protein n=1 Tax=Plantibacter sp. YIM 135249 TaxID=3423918 RepID=UPI003D342D0B
MLSVTKSRELQAVILALKQMQTGLRRSIFKATRSAIVPEWQQELRANATTSLEERVIAGGARADVTAERVTLKAAQSTRKLSGGASPRDLGHAVEFGAKWRRGQVEATSSAGKPYRYSRVLNKQLKPRRSAGYSAWPAATRLAPRFAALWVQTTVRILHEAFEGKSS